MKHAYLIMAHNEPYILEKQLKLIDNKDNDIYIHIDIKSKDLNEDEIKGWVTKSNLYFTKRMDTRWGTNSLVNCELMLLEEATKRNKYVYYHLISGVDMPLKTQKEIHDFFNKHNGTEFVHYSYHQVQDIALDRVKYYHIFNNNLKIGKKWICTIRFKISKLIVYVQKLLHINRIKDKEYYFGSQWFDITDDLARYIVENKSKIEKEYRYSFCPDEMFIQTLIKNTQFYNKLYKKKNGDYEANVRCIDFNRGCPYVFKKEDFDCLMNSGMLFARKFSTKEDKKVIDMIYNKLKK